MKMMLLAAAAALAIPAMATAQDTPQTTPPADSSTMTPPADPAAPPPADPAAMPQQPPMAAQSTGTTDTAMPQPMASGSGTMTAGGYAPSGPAISGTPAPGATVTFQPAPPPSQAFPPPAPKAEYPICKKGQYDGCMQASDARGAKKKMRRK
jgi:hypothetical protein